MKKTVFLGKPAPSLDELEEDKERARIDPGAFLLLGEREALLQRKRSVHLEGALTELLERVERGLITQDETAKLIRNTLQSE